MLSAHFILRNALLILMGIAWLSGSKLRADTINFVGLGQNGYGSFSGSISVDSLSATLAEITVELTNTTAPASRGGTITGFAFNNPNSSAGGDIGGVVETPPGYSSTNSNFKAIGAPEYENGIVVDDGVNAAPFGMFDLGAALGGNWSGGGNPNNGIAIGNTASFVFKVFGTNLNNLSAASIFETPSEANPKDKDPQTLVSFVVRFRGGDNPQGWSDKAVAVEDPKDPEDPEDPEDPNPVPAPAGGVLAAMAAVFGLGWRFRKG